MIQHNVQIINSFLFYLDMLTKLIHVGICPNQTQIDGFFFSFRFDRIWIWVWYSPILKHGYGTGIGI